jgi:23S rRNA pseudouridine1911/1915/1917 synthase
VPDVPEHNEDAATTKWQMLYTDNHLLVVYKAPGLLAQGDRTGDASLVDHAKAWLKAQYQKPGNVYVGLVHRLDRPVGGVMVLARTSKAAARLSQQFRERRVDKVYQAIVEGSLSPREGVLEGGLDGKDCRLSYRTLAAGAHRSELEVRPHTGRKHQIRRQLAEAGHPIVGDRRYGAKGALARRCIALAATSLEFDHPTRDERLCFGAPLPGWWPPVS